MKKIIIIILLISLFSIGCATKTNTFSIKEYDSFVNTVYNFKEKFSPKDFKNINSEGPLVKQIWVLPENTLIDKRTNDSINGDTNFPSKYEIYYLKDDSSVLTKVVFIYNHIDYEGIILHSVVSPEDNVTLKEDYHNLNRPFVINKIISYGNYLVSVQYFLIENKKLANDEQKIRYLLNVDNEFYRQLELFLLNM